MSDPSGDFVVGVDAGGTSTVAALARDGIVHDRARTGPANATSIGVDRALTEIVEAVAAVIPEKNPRALFVAAAGARRTSIREALAAGLRSHFPGIAQIAVDDDLRVALRAAISDGPGVVVIGGTGSVAYGEAGAATTTVGGAGYLLGDEGSAYAIGLAAMRLATRSYDGRARRDETVAFVERAFGAATRDAFLDCVYGEPLDVARVAALAPAIVAFAGKGNRASTKIVQSAAEDLGALVIATVDALALRETSPSIALAGGLLRENTLLSHLLETRIVGSIAGAQIVRVRDEPVIAAVRFATATLAP